MQSGFLNHTAKYKFLVLHYFNKYNFDRDQSLNRDSVNVCLMHVSGIDDTFIFNFATSYIFNCDYVFYTKNKNKTKKFVPIIEFTS